MENQTVLTKLQSNIDLKEGEPRIISIPLPQKKKRKNY